MWPKVIGYNVIGLLIFLAGAVASVAIGLLTAHPRTSALASRASEMTCRTAERMRRVQPFGRRTVGASK